MVVGAVMVLESVVSGGLVAWVMLARLRGCGGLLSLTGLLGIVPFYLSQLLGPYVNLYVLLHMNPYAIK